MMNGQEEELQQRVSITSSIESDTTECRLNSTTTTSNNNNTSSTKNKNSKRQQKAQHNAKDTSSSGRSSNSKKKRGTQLLSSLDKEQIDSKTVGLGYTLRNSSKNPKQEEEEDLEQGLLEQDEAKLRHSIYTKRSWTRFGRDLLASIFAFIMYLITVETILCCALTISLTVVWFNRYGNGDGNTWNGGGMDWVVLGFAVVTPITVTIGLAFRRRELALLHITRLRSSAFQIYLSHTLWDWAKVDFTTTAPSTSSSTESFNNQNSTNGMNKTGRSKKTLKQKLQTKGGRSSLNQIDWQQHSDQVLEHLVGIGDELSRFLTLPTSSRTNHRMLRGGRREAASIVEVAYRLFDSLYTQRITKLSILTEELKTYGLSPSEASRIRQYERFIGEAVEGLRMIKMYRTPLALRSFGRIFTMVLPPLYSPTFAQLAFDLNSLAFGILFALVTPLCLTALFESMRALEDPFVAWITLDGIDIIEEFEVLHFHQLINARMSIFPNASPFEERSKNAIDIYTQNGSSHTFFNQTATNMMDRSLRSRTSRYSLNGSAHSRNMPSLDGSSRVSHFNRLLALDGEQGRSTSI